MIALIAVEPGAPSQRPPNDQAKHVAGIRRSLALCCGPVSGNRGRALLPKRHLLGPWHGGNKRASTREVRVGSIASFPPSADDFRSSPVNGHSQDRPACLKRAKLRLADAGRSKEKPPEGGLWCCVFLCYRWKGSATFVRLDAFCRGSPRASRKASRAASSRPGRGRRHRRAHRHPLQGRAPRFQPHRVDRRIALSEFDFIDIGALLPASAPCRW